MICSRILYRSGCALLDFIEQQHGDGGFVDGIGKHAALVEADISRRRADQLRPIAAPYIPTYRTGSYSTPRSWSCSANSVLPTPVGPKIDSSQPACPPSRKPARDSLIAPDKASMALSWPNTTFLSVCSRCFRASSASSSEMILEESARFSQSLSSISLVAMLFRRLLLGKQHLVAAPGFVDYVDRLIRQVCGRGYSATTFHRGFDGRIGVAHIMVRSS